MNQTQTRINLMRKAPTFEERLELARNLREKYPFLSDLPTDVDTAARYRDPQDTHIDYPIIILN
jgi:hypothetical protein